MHVKLRYVIYSLTLFLLDRDKYLFITLVVYHVTKPSRSRVDTLVDQLSTIFSGHVDFINHGHGTLLTWPVWCSGIVDLKHYISALSAKLRCSSSYARAAAACAWLL